MFKLRSVSTKGASSLMTDSSSKSKEYNISDEQKFEESMKSRKQKTDDMETSTTFEESGQDVEYSADIKPLKFKMNRLPELDQKITSPKDYLHSMEQIREQINKISNIDKTNGPNTLNGKWNFSFIDREQFEEYLKEPSYIRCLPRRTHFGLFKRLFLAQELKELTPITTDSNIMSSDLNNNNNTNNSNIGKTRNRGRSIVSSGNLNGDLTHKAIWTIQFSLDGRYMATGSKDGSVKIWKVISSPVERWELDNLDESNKATEARVMLRKKQVAASSTFDTLDNSKIDPTLFADLEKNDDTDISNLYAPVFHPLPFRSFSEHTFDVLDLDWSKNNFLLTASMDKTVKLWHVNRKESLRTFQHADFVTGVKFHPIDDRFFITGCLDHKCRLWSIIDNEVGYDYDCQDLITSITVSKNDGKYTVVGTFNGFVHILLTKGLSLVSKFHVRDKAIYMNGKGQSEYSDSKIQNGPRVTGLQIYQLNPADSVKLLITTNDSRIRIFDMEKRKLVEFLKGFHSGSSQHKAQFTFWENQPTVICSSDDHWLYGWKLRTGDDDGDPNEPEKGLNISGSLRDYLTTSSSLSIGSGDLNEDDITKSDKHRNSVSYSSPKKNTSRRSRLLSSLRNLAHPHHHSNDSAKKNSRYVAFHAHHAPVTTSMVAPVETSKVLSLSNDFICELTLQTLKESENMDEEDGKLNITNFGASPSNEVNAIGTILISTDNQGVIRVFRSDISTKIRSKVLNQLQTYNKIVENGGQSLEENGENLTSYSTIDANNINNTASTMRSENETPKNSRSYERGKTNDIISTPDGPLYVATGGNASNCIFKNSSMNNSTNSISSQRPITRTHGKSSGSIASNNGFSLRCNVCNGTSFIPVGKNTLGQRDVNYSCADCGTTLNNFR